MVPSTPIACGCRSSSLSALPTLERRFQWLSHTALQKDDFFLQSLKEEAFAGDIRSVKVVVGDRAGGLIASLALIGLSLLFNYNVALTQLPIGNPDPVPKKVWRKKKVHGPADAAGLTSAEIAGKDLLAKEKAESAASRAANHGPEPADEEDPGLLPPSTAPPRLEESGSTKRTRGRTLDFVALHTGAASKKGKP
jgi:hypothetical protein